MRPVRCFLLSTVILGAVALGHAQSPADEIRLNITKNVMDEISQDELTSVRDQFSPDLKDSLTESEMRTELTELVKVAGAFQRQLSQTTRTMQGKPIYVSKSQFEKFKVELKLVFNDSNQITDVWLLPVSDLTPENMEATAKQIPDLLRQERFEDVSSQFDDRMKSMMPTDRLHDSWFHVVTHLGQFKGVRSARKDPEFDAVDVRCDFEHGPMIVRVAFDPNGKIGGLWMLPAEPEKDSQT